MQHTLLYLQYYTLPHTLPLPTTTHSLHTMTWHNPLYTTTHYSILNTLIYIQYYILHTPLNTTHSPVHVPFKTYALTCKVLETLEHYPLVHAYTVLHTLTCFPPTYSLPGHFSTDTDKCAEWIYSTSVNHSHTKTHTDTHTHTNTFTHLHLTYLYVCMRVHNCNTFGNKKWDYFTERECLFTTW